jgi:hypothetical protein
MANHDPRMNRTNPKYRTLLGIVGTWSTSCDSCNCLLIALCVLDIVCSCLVCFLSVWCYMVLVLIFGLSAFKILRCVKPWIGSLSRNVFYLSLIYVSSSSIRKVLGKTLTLTLIIVGYDSSRNTYPRSHTIVWAECLKLRQDLFTTSGKQKIDPPCLQGTSRRQRLH